MNAQYGTLRWRYEKQVRERNRPVTLCKPEVSASFVQAPTLCKLDAGVPALKHYGCYLKRR